MTASCRPLPGTAWSGADVRLATFVTQGRERFGLVIDHPASGEPWIFDPERAVRRLELYGSKQTSPLAYRTPNLRRSWPRQLVGLLELGTEGLDAARRLQDQLLGFLASSDQALLAGAGLPLANVELRAPIPRPRLFFGLVQNSPTFVRNDPGRSLVNVYPQGHQRTHGSLLGPGDPVVVTAEMTNLCWTPEPGIVIGRGGRDIPAAAAHDHIAGYTLVMDLVHDRYTDQHLEAAGGTLDWFADATGSWLGKKSDTMGAMGPFLTTSDEVANPYDLLLTTRQSGWLRDRAHTGSMLIGFERLIAWLSSFVALRPGDVLHTGTLAYDGMILTDDMPFGPDDYIEGDLERVGRLRLPVVYPARDDWRSERDPGRSIHPVPAVRDLVESGHTDPVERWDFGETRHLWTSFGNARSTEAPGNSGRPPRILNAPPSLLARSGSRVRIPVWARTLTIGIELAFVVNRPAHRVRESEAGDFVLGYSPMIVAHDSSFAEAIRSPATPQEANLPAVYARWPDGFNVIAPDTVALAPSKIRGRTMGLSVPGLGVLEASTDAYLLLAPEILAFLTQEITLFPHDVVTLGRLEALLELPPDHPLAADFTVTAAIDGMSEVHARFIRGETHP